jgi:hypothetical protein
MIADSSSHGEMEIYLDNDEISRLEKEVLKGVLAIRDRDGNKTTKPLLVKVGKTDKRYIVDLKLNPPKSNFPAARQYLVILSKYAYSELKERGTTGARTSYDKVLIFNKVHRMVHTSPKLLA